MTLSTTLISTWHWFLASLISFARWLKVGWFKLQFQQTASWSLNRIKSISFVKEKKAEGEQGNIRFVFKFTDLRNALEGGLYSKQMEVAGANWYINIDKHKDTVGVYLECRLLSASYFYEAEYTISLFSPDQEAVLTRTGKHAFTEESEFYGGWVYFTSLATIMNPEYGLINELGDAVVEATFSVKKSVKILPEIVTNFNQMSTAKPFVDDCLLIVNSHRIHANKGLLAFFSPHFCGLFKEEGWLKVFTGILQLLRLQKKQLDEYFIEDVGHVEFIYLLNELYPSKFYKEISETNVELLLRMSKRFQVASVIEKCENYLRSCPNDEVPLEKKLLLSQDYNLSILQDFYLRKCKSADETDMLIQNEQLEDIKNTPEYTMLSDEIKRQLFENLYLAGTSKHLI